MANKHIIISSLLLLLNFTSFFTCTISCPTCPTPLPPPSPPPPTPIQTPCPPPPKKPSTPSGGHGACPIDTLKLSSCVDMFGGLVHSVIGQDVKSECCPVVEGVSDFDAALCLCTVIKAKAMDVKLILPVAIEVLIDCGKHIPSDYQCP